MSKTIIFTAGGFDPLHIGHIDLIERSRALDPEAFLLVSVAKDSDLYLKKGFVFMPAQERLRLVSALQGVDEVELHQGTDGTVRDNLRALRASYPKARILFTKGGDRDRDNIPEAVTCNALDIEIVDRLGDKIQSSTNLLETFERRGQQRSG